MSFPDTPSLGRRSFDSYVHIYNSHPTQWLNGIKRYYQISMCALTIIASFFLVLAAHQIFPSGINTISSFGAGGYVMSWGLMGAAIALLGFTFLKNYFRPSGNDVTSYRNEASLELRPFSEYPGNHLFVTEDNYCLIVEEVAQLLRNQFCFYNPYTQVRLSDADRDRLLEVPQIARCWQELRQQQADNASKISEETVRELVVLAEGCLNRAESDHMPSAPVPNAQGALDRFAEYYGNLAEEERGALDDYWVPQSLSFDFNSKTMKFGDFYCFLDQNCMHSVGIQIVQMVRQLNPDARLFEEAAEYVGIFERFGFLKV